MITKLQNQSITILQFDNHVIKIYTQINKL